MKLINNYTDETPILYPLSGEVGKGKYTLVEMRDVPKMFQHSWSLGTNGYVRTQISGKTINLARLLLGTTDPKIQTDHENRNTLDNRRYNLKECTSSENLKNRRGWGGWNWRKMINDRRNK